MMSKQRKKWLYQDVDGCVHERELPTKDGYTMYLEHGDILAIWSPKSCLWELYEEAWAIYEEEEAEIYTIWKTIEPC